jgi:predicted anti-sigma-YlaC factor YlaD
MSRTRILLRSPAPLLAALFALFVLPSCGAINKMATKGVANSITKGPDVYSSDNDPELVRDAIPFGLKTIEGLLASLPKNEGLLLAACRGFTQYGVGFVGADASEMPPDQYERQQELQERAMRLCLRARDYGLRGLELHHKGITQRLQNDPVKAASEIEMKELPMLFWTAAAWGSAISYGKDHPDLMADLSAVKALFERGIALNEGYDGGSLHEAMIVLDALPAAMGGSLDRARKHYDRALELSKGNRASVYVSLAENVSVQTQNRAEFRALLEKALAVDAERDTTQRLANKVAQRHAKGLLLRTDDLFLAPDSTQTQESSP